MRNPITGLSTQEAVTQAVALVGRDELKRQAVEWLTERELSDPLYMAMAVEYSARAVIHRAKYQAMLRM